MMYAVVEGEEVLRYGVCQPENLELLAGPGEQAIETPFRASNHWWDGEHLQPKTPMPDIVTGLSVEVPEGTRFRLLAPFFIEGQADESGLLEFDFDEPGTYTVHLSHPRYIDTEVTLHAD